MRPTVAERLNEIDFYRLPHRVVGGCAIPIIEQAQKWLESVMRLAIDEYRFVDELIISSVIDFEKVCPIPRHEGRNREYSDAFYAYTVQNGNPITKPDYFEDVGIDYSKTEIHAIYNPVGRCTHFFMLPSRMAMGLSSTSKE